MSIFAIADTHLSMDPGVDKPMDVFGEEWIDHEKRLAKAWRDLITEDDTVIVAGDISWGLKLDEAMADLRWIHALPGKKVMVKGNHDLWWSGISKLNALFDDMYFIQNTCYDAGGVFICGTRGWENPNAPDFEEKDRKIYDREILRLGYSLKAAKDAGAEEIIGVMHYPPTDETKAETPFTRLFEEYEVKHVVYGHLHGDQAFERGITGQLNGIEYSLVSADKRDCVPMKIV